VICQLHRIGHRSHWRVKRNRPRDPGRSAPTGGKGDQVICRWARISESCNGTLTCGTALCKLLVLECLVLASAIFLVLAAPAKAQIKTHRVGVLMLIKPDRPQLQGLRDGLKAAGYIDGENLRLDMPPLLNLDELRRRAAEFVNHKTDVIVTTGTVETNVAKEITQQLPIVFMPASDPITAGFVKSFPRPGANLTGIAFIRDLDSYGKQLEVFKEVVPSLSKLAVLYDARTSISPYTKGLYQIKKVAFNHSITIDERPIRDINQAEKIVASFSRNTVDGVFVICSSLFGSAPEAIIARTMEKKLPLFSCGGAHEGGLVSFALDLYQMGRRGGWYVSQILKGAKPSDLPVEVPRKYELIINLKTAVAIGIKIPAEVLQRADKVIK
jgi:putative tryptophan/tyrosine transport system substrate-binding protein